MKSTIWWITASISFFVSTIMFVCGSFVDAVALSGWLVLLGLGLCVSGWVCWVIGLISYFRRR